MAARNARRVKIRHDDETRAKIQAAQIINRLHGCVMGKVELTGPQVTAAKTLLAKVLPDLQATTISGDPESPLLVRHSREMTDEELLAIATGSGTGATPQAKGAAKPH